MTKPLRVLFLTLYPDTAASPRYRVTQYLPYLRAHQVECTVLSPLTPNELRTLTGPDRKRRPFWYHLRETGRRLSQILQAPRFDIVFVQKSIMTAYLRGLPELLRNRAHRLVYDIDDAVHLEPPHPLHTPWSALEDRGQIDSLMNMADLVLAGNAWLTAIAQKHNPHTRLFPTVVDTDRFTPATRKTDTYRIGWVGNPSTTICLEPAAQALATMCNGQHNAEVCLVGADPTRTPFTGANIRPWSLDTEVAELHRFTIGIMPQPEGEWMRGKCGLKALQYMAIGIPCVASSFGAVLEFLRHDENGLLAKSTQEWLEAFERLRDPALRQRLSAAGRSLVEEQYSLRKAAPQLLEALRALI